MNDVLVCRKGTVEDIPVFLSFFKTSIPALFTHFSPNSANFTVEVDYGPQWLTDNLKKGNKRLFLAFEDKKLFGYLLVAKSVAGVAFADWLGVNKSYQKRGIASQLLSLWEKDTLMEGSHALQLWTTENNVEFYKKRGFSCGGLFPKAWHGIDCYLIYKALRKPEEKNFLKSYLRQKKQR